MPIAWGTSACWPWCAAAQAIQAAVEREFQRALELNEESFALYTELGDRWFAGIVQWGIGVMATLLGDFEKARSNFRDCLRNAWDIGNRWAAAYPLEAFAALAVSEGQLHARRPPAGRGGSAALRVRPGGRDLRTIPPCARFSRGSRRNSPSRNWLRRARKAEPCPPLRPSLSRSKARNSGCLRIAAPCNHATKPGPGPWPAG